MATIADVLRHLVKHAPDLYDDGRREFLDAVDAAFPEPAAAEPAEPAAAEPQPPPSPPGG
jgi:hypothetical protein